MSNYNVHNMQPNGRLHALIPHPISSIIQKVASETRYKKIK